MSVLLRKPRIDEIADGLDSDTLKAFLDALNSNEGYGHYSLRGGNLPAGTAPSVTKCTLSIDGPAELSGVFVRYTNGSAKAAMVAFTDLDSCITYDIDETKLTCRKVREKLSASELRRVISERLGGGGGVSADVIRKDESGNVFVNNALEVTSEGNAVVGKNLEVDGTTKLNGGFEPIHTYEFEDQHGDVEKINVFCETLNENIGGFDFFGTLSNSFYVLGNYYLESSKLRRFSCIAFDGEERTPLEFVWNNSDKKLFRYYVVKSEKSGSIFEYTLKLKLPGAGSNNESYLTLYSTKFMDYISSVTDFNILVDAQEGDCIAVIVSTPIGTESKVLGNNIRFNNGVWTLYSNDLKYTTSYQGSTINLNLTSVTSVKVKQA